MVGLDCVCHSGSQGTHSDPRRVKQPWSRRGDRPNWSPPRLMGLRALRLRKWIPSPPPLLFSQSLRCFYHTATITGKRLNVIKCLIKRFQPHIYIRVAHLGYRVIKNLFFRFYQMILLKANISHIFYFALMCKNQLQAMAFMSFLH